VLGSLDIKQIPLGSQDVGLKEVLGDWNIITRQEERFVADRKVVLVERRSKGGMFSRDLFFHTTDLQINIGYNPEICSLSEEDLFKMVESMVTGLPLPSSSPILKTEKIYENKVYNFRFRYSPLSVVEERGPPFGSLFFPTFQSTCFPIF